MFSCGVCRTREGVGKQLVNAVRAAPLKRATLPVTPCAALAALLHANVLTRCMWLQATLETLKVPSRAAERELVDAVNDGSEECAPARPVLL